MARAPILQEGQTYSFRSYFELPYEPDEILAELGCTLVSSRLDLPRTAQPLAGVPELRQRLERILPLVNLTNETARRETLVAPVLMEVASLCQCQLRIEYTLNVNPWLRGSLDYLLRARQSLLVVEAKKDDLSRGFTQMAVELIALAQVEAQTTLYGAVTLGNVWQFGVLDVVRQQIVQDLTLYILPDDLETLMAILVGILQATPASAAPASPA